MIDVFVCYNQQVDQLKFDALCSGYMSPEYAVDGKYSVKSDVFSLGVLLLEIVSGRKNRKFHHLSHHHNLLGHVSTYSTKFLPFSLFFY